MKKHNKIERLKSALSPAAFLEVLEKVDWSNLSEADRFYLKNYGIYNIKLRPKYWMLRLRSDGGILPAEHLQIIAEAAQKHQLKILLTARAQIELHDIPAETIYPLWKALNHKGISTYQTLTDNFRAIVTDPLNGFTQDTRIPTAPLIRQIQKYIYADPRWLGTIPRKFNTAIIGREYPSFNPWGNDLLFALAQKDGVWGFNLYLGGKNSEVAQDIDLFCLPNDVPELFVSIATMYHTYGLRGSRAKVRLYHLIETVGIIQVRRWITAIHNHPLQSSGTLKMHSSRNYHDPDIPIERYGHWGELPVTTASTIAQKAMEDSCPLRLTPHQELWLISPTPQQIDSIRQKPTTNTPITACAGSRYCPLSLWDIKQDLPDLPLEKLKQHGISLGFSGCLKGCGRHYHSDLGLIGLRTSNYGHPERAVRLFLGAVESPVPTPARMLYYVVPTRKLTELLDLILEDFLHSKRDTFEQYAHQILHHYSDDFLRLWYMLRQYFSKEELPYETFFHTALEKEHEEKMIEKITTLEGFPQGENLYERMRLLSHILWDKPGLCNRIVYPLPDACFMGVCKTFEVNP